MPPELFITHTYKITAHYDGPLREADHLYVECMLLNLATKQEITKDGKPSIEGTTSAPMIGGSGVLRVRFTDTSYHHQKADFILRVSLLLPDGSGQFKIIYSQLSAPFKVYSKKRAGNAGSAPPFPTIVSNPTPRNQAITSPSGPNSPHSSLAPPSNANSTSAPSTSTSSPALPPSVDPDIAALLPRYIQDPTSLTPQQRHAVRILFVQSTPVGEVTHFEDLSKSMLEIIGHTPASSLAPLNFNSALSTPFSSSKRLAGERNGKPTPIFFCPSSSSSSSSSNTSLPPPPPSSLPNFSAISALADQESVGQKRLAQPTPDNVGPWQMVSHAPSSTDSLASFRPSAGQGFRNPVTGMPVTLTLSQPTSWAPPAETAANPTSNFELILAASEKSAIPEQTQQQQQQQQQPSFVWNLRTQNFGVPPSPGPQ